MLAADIRIGEGMTVGLLARCADSRFNRFAEELVRVVRARKGMTNPIYSALMKVYAFSARYDKAFDLYLEILADGLEPDSMMYGGLMKFAVECGRTDLSRTLGDTVPSWDIQAYMPLIRAAGRDKDVNRAFAVLKRLKDTGVSLDIAAYNLRLGRLRFLGRHEARAFPHEGNASVGFARCHHVQHVAEGLLRDARSERRPVGPRRDGGGGAATERCLLQLLHQLLHRRRQFRTDHAHNGPHTSLSQKSSK